VNDTGFIQVRELGHVVCFIELGRVDFVDAIGCYLALLQAMSACVLYHVA
jgi:hypothetical protein